MKKFMLILVMMAAAAPLYAAQGDLATFGIALGAGLAISLAALGGGIGQGIAMRGALEGIARNPNASDKIFTPMIIGLALIESLVIYALVIGFMLTAKIDNVGDAVQKSGEARIEIKKADKAADKAE